MVKKIPTLLLCFFICAITSVYGQYTEVINSNKPGFSESPYSVGTGIYQFETNLFYRNTSIEPTFSEPQSFGVDLLFRTSFISEKLELNTQIGYQRDKIAFNNIFTSHYFTSGISKLTVAAKYLLFQPKYEDKSKEIRSWRRRMAFDKKRLIPAVAIYAGLNTDFLGENYKIGSISPKVGILLQNNLSKYFNIITNVYYNNIGTNFSEISYVITGTYNFSDRWSWFLENQAIFREFQNDNNIGGGFAYLFSRNLQINTSGRYIIEGNANGAYATLGVSYRIDKHKDAYEDLDENVNKIKNNQNRRNLRKRKGFFGRLFGIFGKKN